MVLQRECVKSMMVAPWTPDYSIDSALHVLVWVRFLKLHIQYWGSDALGKIASQLGTLIEMDLMTKTKSQPNYARVKV